MPTTTSDRYTFGINTNGGAPMKSAATRTLINRTTSVTSGFFGKIKLGGLLAPLPYSIRKRHWVYSVGSFMDYYKVPPPPLYPKSPNAGWSGCLRNSFETAYMGDISWLEPTVAEKTGLDNALSSRALSKIKSSQINIAQAFAERRQTVSLIATTLRRLHLGFTGLKRGDLSAFARSLKLSSPTTSMARAYRRSHGISPVNAATSAWLEYAYGVRPLLSDVYAAMEVFEKPIVKPAGVVRVTSTIRREDTLKTSGTYVSTVTTRRLRVTRGMVVAYELDGDGSVFTRSMTQIGLTNPALLAWELLPYSFVVDWFLPVGNYLSSLDATFGLRFKHGSKSDKWVRTSHRVSSGSGLPGGPSVYTVGSSVDRFSDEWFDRFVLTSFPSPVAPSLKDPCGVSHALSAFSLLYQLLRR